MLKCFLKGNFFTFGTEYIRVVRNFLQLPLYILILLVTYLTCLMMKYSFLGKNDFKWKGYKCKNCKCVRVIELFPTSAVFLSAAIHNFFYV